MYTHIEHMPYVGHGRVRTSRLLDLVSLFPGTQLYGVLFVVYIF